MRQKKSILIFYFLTFVVFVLEEVNKFMAKYNKKKDFFCMNEKSNILGNP
jgi:hypothetical protein